MESVSSSVGGLRKPFAALKAGAADITNPSDVQKMPMARTLMARR